MEIANFYNELIPLLLLLLLLLFCCCCCYDTYRCRAL